MSVNQPTPNELLDLVDPKNPTLLKEMGGVEGLVKKLNSDVVKVIKILIFRD
jgi:hypothetical protein